mmetsp:Transcript_7658/g.20934  ORF Transcript_7658/g.20934 Transcript_7658/m.20934 type:complete len:369 (+) Transcript_7658:803-1909(+)
MAAIPRAVARGCGSRGRDGRGGWGRARRACESRRARSQCLLARIVVRVVRVRSPSSDGTSNTGCHRTQLNARGLRLVLLVLLLARVLRVGGVLVRVDRGLPRAPRPWLRAHGRARGDEPLLALCRVLELLLAPGTAVHRAVARFKLGRRAAGARDHVGKELGGEPLGDVGRVLALVLPRGGPAAAAPPALQGCVHVHPVAGCGGSERMRHRPLPRRELDDEPVASARGAVLGACVGVLVGLARGLRVPLRRVAALELAGPGHPCGQATPLATSLALHAVCGPPGPLVALHPQLVDEVRGGIEPALDHLEDDVVLLVVPREAPLGVLGAVVPYGRLEVLLPLPRHGALVEQVSDRGASQGGLDGGKLVL